MTKYVASLVMFKIMQILAATSKLEIGRHVFWHANDAAANVIYHIGYVR